MASVTLHITGLDEPSLRRVLLAHHKEHELGAQPTNIGASHAREHDGNKVGAIVRIEGGSSFTVTSFPLIPASAAIVTNAIGHYTLPDDLRDQRILVVQRYIESEIAVPLSPAGGIAADIIERLEAAKLV